MFTCVKWPTAAWCRDHQGELEICEDKLQDISKPGGYGIDVTLHALADCLNITIKVATEQGNGSPINITEKYTYRQLLGDSSEVVYLYWSF